MKTGIAISLVGLLLLGASLLLPESEAAASDPPPVCDVDEHEPASVVQVAES